MSSAADANGRPDTTQMIALQTALRATENAWYCIRTQYHRESLAEYSLRHVMEVECFLPRIRYRKARHQIVEPLFPGYLFAYFDLSQSLRKIHYCQGVSTIVHFGKHWPAIPESALQQIRALIGAEGVKDLEEPFQHGDRVEVLDGPFRGFEAIVTRVVPAHERICVLLEFLGRQTAVQLGLTGVRLTDGLGLRARQSSLAAPP
jgi:transcriptional antiterminator RfaH